MRRLAAVLAGALVLLASPARADQTDALILTAQQIALFPDRGMLLAQGGVALHLPGMQIGAARAGYDLRANRLVAAGNVSVTTPSGSAAGSGYIYDFRTGRGRFDASARVPEYASPEAVALGQQVELHPGQSIGFANAQVRSGSTFSPAASYTYAIPPPSAKDFGYSPVPSAALEYPFLMSSGANAYTFARVRYDKYNGGAGAGFEEHYARTDRGYVAIAQTQDADAGRLDLAAYQRLSDSVWQTLTGSSYPGTHALRYAVSASGARGFASLSFAQYGGTRSDDLIFAGNQRPFSRAGTVRFAIDFGHDVHPWDYAGAQDLRLTPSLNFSSAGLRVGSATLSTSLDLGESVYNYGRGTLHSSQTFWGTFPAAPRLIFTGGATFAHDAPPFPATYRTYTLGATWRASRAFNFVSSLTYAHDYAQAFDVGRPQFSAAVSVRMVRKDGRGLEVGAILPFGVVGNMNRQAAFNLRFVRE